jgi:hypothetical protein
MIDINYDEWIKAIEAAEIKNSEVGLTSNELMDIIGSRERIRKFLRDGINNGSIILGERYIPKDWDGRARYYKVYSLRK